MEYNKRAKKFNKFFQNIFCTTNCFDGVFIDKYKLAQFPIYKFSKLSYCIESACNIFPTIHRTSKNNIDFRFVTTEEILLTAKNELK